MKKKIINLIGILVAIVLIYPMTICADEISKTTEKDSESANSQVRTIEDGEYEIRSAIDDTKIFDIDVASSRLQYWTDSDVRNQRFYVKYNGNGYYELECRATGKNIEAENGSKSEGATICQGNKTGADTQLWTIKDLGDGYYSIISKYNGFSMTSENDEANNGSDIKLFENSKKKSQKFKMDKVLKDTGKKTIEDGEYEIRSAIDDSKILDIDVASSRLQYWTDSDVRNQRFFVKYSGNGYYELECRATGKNVEVANESISIGAAACQGSKNGSDTQLWIIKDLGNGYYSIVSKYNGYYMTSENDKAGNGTNIKLYENSNKSSQKFKMDKVLKDTGKKTVEDGEYEIRSAIDDTKIFDIDVASSRLQYWEDCDVRNQRFYIRYNGNGFYELECRATERNIQVANESISVGTAVCQGRKNGDDTQLWIIKDLGDGYYSFVSKYNGYYMTSEDDDAQNGSNIKLYENEKKLSQKFKMDKILKDTGTKTIEDGEYEIRSAIDDTKIFDIDVASSRLQYWEDGDVRNQRFYITYKGNGYYELECKATGKNVEVADESIKSGAATRQGDKTGADTQLWIIKDCGDGYYSFVSKYNGYYMTSEGEKIQNGTNIILYNGNKKNNQKFKMDKVLKDVGTKTIEDGEYEIRSAIDDTKIFDIDVASSRLQYWEDCDVRNQRFYIRYNENGFYELECRATGKNIEVKDENIKAGAEICQNKKMNSDAQLWIIKDLGDGYYSFVSKYNGYYMTSESNQAYNGTNIKLYENGKKKSQKFKLTKFESVLGGKSIENGEYEIRSAIDDSKILDVDIASSSLQLWEDSNVHNQRFYVTYLNNGYYKMCVRQTGKSLDVQDGSLSEGARVQQYDYYGSEQQTWIIKETSDGYYNIISKCDGYYMTAMDSNASNGTKIKMYEKNEENTQKFKFQRLNDSLGIDVSSHNGVIDWRQVKESGVSFAMIRVGYRGYETGKVVYDSRFTYNIENAIKNDIEVGVYFYSQALDVDEAIEEADFVVNAIRNYRISCPVVIDSEFVNDKRVGRGDWLSKSERTAVCKAFCERIKQRGYEPMIYASKSWFYDELNFNQLSYYSVWVAHYTYDPERRTNFKYAYNIWQYTDRGSIPGIKTDVDLNLRNAK